MQVMQAALAALAAPAGAEAATMAAGEEQAAAGASIAHAMQAGKPQRLQLWAGSRRSHHLQRGWHHSAVVAAMVAAAVVKSWKRRLVPADNN